MAILFSQADGSDQHYDTYEEFEQAFILMKRMNGEKVPQDLLGEVKAKYGGKEGVEGLTYTLNVDTSALTEKLDEEDPEQDAEEASPTVGDTVKLVKPIRSGTYSVEESVGMTAEVVEDDGEDYKPLRIEMKETLQDEMVDIVPGAKVYVDREDVELFTENRFKVGDKVRVISAEDGTDSPYHGFTIGSTVEVEEVYGNGRLDAYNGIFHQTLLPHHYEKEDAEEVSTTEFRTGDIVKVTETFKDIHGDVASGGSVYEYDDWGDSFIFVGTVVLGDNHDKLRLVCRKEDRKDIDL